MWESEKWLGTVKPLTRFPVGLGPSKIGIGIGLRGARAPVQLLLVH